MKFDSMIFFLFKGTELIAGSDISPIQLFKWVDKFFDKNDIRFVERNMLAE